MTIESMKMLQAKQNKATVTAAAWGYGVDQLWKLSKGTNMQCWRSGHII